MLQALKKLSPKMFPGKPLKSNMVLPFIHNFKSPASEGNIKNLTTYINSAYYLLCCPFRLKLISGHYQLITWLPQALLFAFLSLLNTYLWIGFELMPSFPKETKDPSTYLQFVLRISSGVFRLFLVKLLVFDRKQVENVANCLLRDRDLITKTRNNKRRWDGRMWAFLLPLEYIGIAVSRLVELGPIEPCDPVCWSELWWNKMIKFGRSMCFIKDESFLQEFGFRLGFGILGAITSFYRYVCK